MVGIEAVTSAAVAATSMENHLKAVFDFDFDGMEPKNVKAATSNFGEPGKRIF